MNDTIIAWKQNKTDTSYISCYFFEQDSATSCSTNQGLLIQTEIME